MNKWTMIAAAAAVACATSATADSTDARCDIYLRGSDKVSKMIACTFSPRQGAVTIYRSDDITHDLSLH